MNRIGRDRILEAIVSGLAGEDYVLALWLEGADGTNSLDEYSDIDLVCYAKEGRVNDAVRRLGDALEHLGTLNIAYEQPGRPANNRYKAYHLTDTPGSLLIDVTFQSESFPVSFLPEDRTAIPLVLFDKASIVKFEPADAASRRSQLQNQLTQAKGIFSQRSRAVKYTRRGLFLESLAYYHKYVLHPVVDVLRIVHTPLQPDCFLVHATRDFPAPVVSMLETLYAVRTVEDIAERIKQAEDLFASAVAEAERLLP